MWYFTEAYSDFRQMGCQNVVPNKYSSYSTGLGRFLAALRAANKISATVSDEHELLITVK